MFARIMIVLAALVACSGIYVFFFQGDKALAVAVVSSALGLTNSAWIDILDKRRHPSVMAVIVYEEKEEEG